MKKIVRSILIFAVIALLSTGLWANGLNLNGSGTKAVSMGGAFVGLADDYSAIFWNPAGLTQIKGPTLSLFQTNIMPKVTYEFPMLGIDTETTQGNYPSGALAFVKPISDRLTVGVMAYAPSGLGANWDGGDLALLSGATAYKWESMVGIIALSPAAAIKLSDKFSVGLAVNIYYGFLKVKRPALGQYDEDLDGLAVSATLGMMYQPSEKLSFGFTYKTPAEVRLEGNAEMSMAPALGLGAKSEAERQADWPAWIAFGVAFKPTDKLTITADAQFTDWQSLTDIPITYLDPMWQKYFAADSKFELRWDSKIQLRFGLEYWVSDKVAVRGGYMYDPSPGPIETVNILLPQFTYNWITLGFGYRTEKISLDLGFEYGIGKDIEVPFGLQNAMPGKHGMSIFVPNIAFQYRF